MKNFTLGQLRAYKAKLSHRYNLSIQYVDDIVEKCIIKAFDYGNGKYEYQIDTEKVELDIRNKEA